MSDNMHIALQLMCYFLEAVVLVVVLHSLLYQIYEIIQHKRLKCKTIKYWVERSKLLEYHVCYDQMTYDQAVLYSTFYENNGGGWRIANSDELYLMSFLGEPRREIGFVIWFWVLQEVGSDKVWQYYVTSRPIKDLEYYSYTWENIRNNNLFHPQVPAARDSLIGVCLVRNRN